MYSKMVPNQSILCQQYTLTSCLGYSIGKNVLLERFQVTYCGRYIENDKKIVYFEIIAFFCCQNWHLVGNYGSEVKGKQGHILNHTHIYQVKVHSGYEVHFKTTRQVMKLNIMNFGKKWRFLRFLRDTKKWHPNFLIFFPQTWEGHFELILQ